VAAETDAYKMTHAKLKHCQRKQVKVFDNTSIVAINHEKRSVAFTTGDGKKIKTRKLFIACCGNSCMEDVRLILTFFLSTAYKKKMCNPEIAHILHKGKRFLDSFVHAVRPITFSRKRTMAITNSK
jgi:hypothetical protein